jgi:hypothetical protein
MRCIGGVLTVLGVCALLSTVGHGADEKASRFLSARTQHTFLGATQLALSSFRPNEKEATSAMLLLDANEVTFSQLGDLRVTAVAYKPIEVKLTPVAVDDASGSKRRAFAVELPKEQKAALGKNTLRLVWPISGTKNQPVGVRLMLVDPAGKVQQTVELWSARDL